MNRQDTPGKSIRVAAVQYAPALKTRTGTVELVPGAIEEAAGKGVQPIVFPETFIPSGPYFWVVLPPAMISDERANLGHAD